MPLYEQAKKIINSEEENENQYDEQNNNCDINYSIAQTQPVFHINNIDRFPALPDPAEERMKEQSIRYNNISKEEKFQQKDFESRYKGYLNKEPLILGNNSANSLAACALVSSIMPDEILLTYGNVEFNIKRTNYLSPDCLFYDQVKLDNDTYEVKDEEKFMDKLKEEYKAANKTMNSQIESIIRENIKTPIPISAGIVGLHAEVLAINDELNFRDNEPDKDKRKFYVYTLRFNKNTINRGAENAIHENFLACYNCTNIITNIPNTFIMTGTIDKKIVLDKMEIALKKHFMAKMSEMSPVKNLETIIDMVKIAAENPSLIAAIVKNENHAEKNFSNLLAEVVAGGGMAPLAEAWISLLHLLYEKKYLNGKEVISIILPDKKHDRVKCLADAIAGAAWSSKASTKLCSLLSEIASNDEQLRKDIMERLSMKQSGYGFKRIILDRSADFYNRAKHADEFNQNSAAIGLLKEGHLIPKKRQLYNSPKKNKLMVSGTQAAGINWESSFESLQKTIKDEIAPQILASDSKMKKEKSELEQAKISASRMWNEINAREKEKKKRIYDETTALFAAHYETQELLNSQSSQRKDLEWELTQKSKKQDKTPSWKGPVATASSPLFMPRVKNPDTSNTDDKKNTSTNQPTDEWLRLPEVPYNPLFDDLSSDDPKTRDLEIRIKMLKAPDPIETELPINKQKTRPKKQLTLPLLKD